MSTATRQIRASVLTWANEGGPISKMLFAIAVGLIVISGALLRLQGLPAVPHGLLAYLPIATAVFLSVVISPEAYANGYGSKVDFWHRLGKRLLVLLTVALVLRGLAVGLVAYYLGLDLHIAMLIGTGLTATDPAAIGITQAVAGTAGNPLQLEELFWLYAMESLANDGLASLVFEFAEGYSWSSLTLALLLTLFLGAALALSDEGTRWFIREKSLWADTQQAALVEIGAVIALYFSFALVAAVYGALPILTVVIGAVGADYFFTHRIPDEQNSRDVKQKRKRLAQLWMEWGLAAYLCLAVGVMPYRVLFGNPKYLVGGLCLLILGIFGARVLYEIGHLLLSHRGTRTRSTSVQLSGMSVILASTLLGVPTFVAISLFEDEEMKAAYYVFATILESWLLVPLAVLYIAWVRRKLLPFQR